MTWIGSLLTLPPSGQFVSSHFFPTISLKPFPKYVICLESCLVISIHSLPVWSWSMILPKWVPEPAIPVNIFRHFWLLLWLASIQRASKALLDENPIAGENCFPKQTPPKPGVLSRIMWNTQYPIAAHQTRVHDFQGSLRDCFGKGKLLKYEHLSVAYI